MASCWFTTKCSTSRRIRLAPLASPNHRGAEMGQVGDPLLCHECRGGSRIGRPTCCHVALVLLLVPPGLIATPFQMRVVDDQTGAGVPIHITADNGIGRATPNGKRATDA